MNRDEQITAFTDAIWEWYATHKRALPWRDMDISDDTERAYRVMVSEIMLQQTQVSRVIIVFRNFLETFPTLQSLADANNAEVIMAWRGMGYNSRALRLRDAAKIVMMDYKGVFPRGYDQLLSIKGLGPYTAGAIRNFAFNIPTPCIDTNIRRILHRVFVGPEEEDGRFQMSDRELLKIAAEVLSVAVPPPPLTPPPRGEGKKNKLPLPPSGERGWGLGGDSIEREICRTAADWHAALMDYGSLVQTKSSPKWSQCILIERGLMKTTPENWKPPIRGAAKEKLKQEPGRYVGSTYIPNRIFRGKIVEALRDEENGLSADEIGKRICIDWEGKHRKWLDSLIQKLVQEKFLHAGLETYQLYK